MNKSSYVEERFERLRQEMAEQPSLVPSVMAEVRAIGAYQRPPGRRQPPIDWMRVIAVSVVCLIVAGVFWSAQPESLYAQTLAALEKTRTIHVTGKVSQIVRQWPLEADVPTSDDGLFDVNLWYWNDGDPRAFEQYGPVTATRNGGELLEYQSDADLLYIGSRTSRDEVERLASLLSFLAALKEEGRKVRDLGVKTIDGRQARHMRFERGPIIDDYWFDVETKLPVRQERSSTDEKADIATYQLRFAFNEAVPATVASYVPPKASQTRYGMQHDDARLVWLHHVESVAESVAEKATQSPVVVPREQTFGLQYPVDTASGSMRVIPLDISESTPLDLPHFVKLRASTIRGERAMPFWRVDAALGQVDEIVFPRADVVLTPSEKWPAWTNAALRTVGLEVVSQQEDRDYWVARHDGRPLKPFADVKPPVGPQSYGRRVVKGLVKPGVGHRHRPVTLEELFIDFARMQNVDLNGTGPIIVDETGLPKPPEYDEAIHGSWKAYKRAVDYDKYLVASDAPYFAGEKSQSMAKAWFAKEFGITFEVETRPTTVHVIRRIK